MATTENEERYVGPVMKAGEIGDAVIEAIQEDNEGRDIKIEEHASYYRVKVAGECVISLQTLSEIMGREILVSEVEQNMPAFEGFIRVGSDQMRFLSK